MSTEPSSVVWKKSTASDSGACVEVARLESVTMLRDSKDPAGPQLSFTAREWEAFLIGVRAGEFD
jgi:predicted secreted Zn-dependent protease